MWGYRKRRMPWTLRFCQKTQKRVTTRTRLPSGQRMIKLHPIDVKFWHQSSVEKDLDLKIKLASTFSIRRMVALLDGLWLPQTTNVCVSQTRCDSNKHLMGLCVQTPRITPGSCSVRIFIGMTYGVNPITHKNPIMHRNTYKWPHNVSSIRTACDKLRVCLAAWWQVCWAIAVQKTSFRLKANMKPNKLIVECSQLIAPEGGNCVIFFGVDSVWHV